MHSLLHTITWKQEQINNKIFYEEPLTDIFDMNATNQNRLSKNLEHDISTDLIA